jgi:hypothetical protein
LTKRGEAGLLLPVTQPFSLVGNAVINDFGMLFNGFSEFFPKQSLMFRSDFSQEP